MIKNEKMTETQQMYEEMRLTATNFAKRSLNLKIPAPEISIAILATTVAIAMDTLEGIPQNRRRVFFDLFISRAHEEYGKPMPYDN